MTIEVLDEASWDEVGGGFSGVIRAFATAIGGEIVNRSTGVFFSAGESALRWVLQQAPGGADDGTWTATGHSHMGA